MSFRAVVVCLIYFGFFLVVAGFCGGWLAVVGSSMGIFQVFRCFQVVFFLGLSMLLFLCFWLFSSSFFSEAFF